MYIAFLCSCSLTQILKYNIDSTKREDWLPYIVITDFERYGINVESLPYSIMLSYSSPCIHCHLPWTQATLLTWNTKLSTCKYWYMVVIFFLSVGLALGVYYQWFTRPSRRTVDFIYFKRATERGKIIIVRYTLRFRRNPVTFFFFGENFFSLPARYYYSILF